MSSTANPTPIQPGMNARFQGRDYRVTSRLVFGMIEEGVTYYWHEWELVAPDGEHAFLEWEEGRWKLMKPFVPKSPVGPREAIDLRAGASLNLDGHRVRVTQNSQSQIYFVEGEPTFAVSRGQRSNYIDAGYGKHLYGVEWTSSEIEFFRGQYITQREVLTAFGFKKELEALDRLEGKRRSQSVFASVCLVCSLLALMLWGRALSGGTVVASGSVPLSSIEANGVRFGPITLNPQQRVHRLAISATMTQASAWVGGVLETADQTELLDAQRDFWDESGYDSDGAWHESDLKTQRDFIVENPGPYYLRLYTERETPTGNYGEVRYEVRQGVLYPNYLGWFGFLMLLTSLLFYVIGSKEKLSQWAAEHSDDD